MAMYNAFILTLILIFIIMFILLFQYLFAGSLDKHIYLYDPLDNFRCLNILKGHTESVRSMDITADNAFLVSQGEVLLLTVIILYCTIFCCISLYFTVLYCMYVPHR
jgi:hypothetical protein